LSAEESAVIDRLEPLLGDAAIWDDPRPSLGSEVVGAIIGRPSVGSSSPGPRRRWTAAVAGLAVGAAAATVLAFAISGHDGPSPDGEMSIVGTDLAPALRGAGSFTQYHSGLEIEIHMPGLPRREGGDYYELWMHSCDGSDWVPAGTFHDMEYVRGWAGVPAADYPVLKVTRESAGTADNSTHAPSGAVVAQGSLGACPSA
jgi:hypothetical protein